MESTLAAVFLGVAGMVACLLFIVKPLWARGGKTWQAATVMADLLDQKETLLFNIEDLAHEQRLGKISEDDFARLQGVYKKQLVRLMDRMEHSGEVAAGEIARHYDAGGSPTSSPAAPRNDGKRMTRACFACKEFYDADFKFCPKCGAALTVQS